MSAPGFTQASGTGTGAGNSNSTNNINNTSGNGQPTPQTTPSRATAPGFTRDFGFAPSRPFAPGFSSQLRGTSAVSTQWSTFPGNSDLPFTPNPRKRSANAPIPHDGFLAFPLSPTIQANTTLQTTQQAVPTKGQNGRYKLRSRETSPIYTPPTSRKRKVAFQTPSPKRISPNTTPDYPATPPATPARATGATPGATPTAPAAGTPSANVSRISQVDEYQVLEPRTERVQGFDQAPNWKFHQSVLKHQGLEPRHFEATFDGSFAKVGTDWMWSGKWTVRSGRAEASILGLTAQAAHKALPAKINNGLFPESLLYRLLERNFLHKVALVPRDGNCVFYCLADQLERAGILLPNPSPDEKAGTVRRSLATHYGKNKEKYANKVFVDGGLNDKKKQNSFLNNLVKYKGISNDRNAWFTSGTHEFLFADTYQCLFLSLDGKNSRRFLLYVPLDYDKSSKKVESKLSAEEWILSTNHRLYSVLTENDRGWNMLLTAPNSEKFRCWLLSLYVEKFLVVMGLPRP